jgi:hypothetical protein
MTVERLRRFSRRLRPVAVAAAAVGLGLTLWAERSGVEKYPWRFAWTAFVLAVGVFSLGPLLGAFAFWVLLRDLGGPARLGPSVRMWTRSFLARYVPSGALTVAVRLQSQEAVGATGRQLLSATVFEQLAAVIAGALCATAAFVVSGRDPPATALGLLATALVITLATSRLSRLPGDLPRPRARSLAAAASIDCCVWLTAGTAIWILVEALTPSPPSAAFLVGAYALAWLLGFVAIFAPSGLGVREATLVVLLSPHFGVGPAAAIAVVLRLADTVADLVAAGAVELASIARARSRASVGSIGPALPAGNHRSEPSLVGAVDAPTRRTARPRRGQRRRNCAPRPHQGKLRLDQRGDPLEEREYAPSSQRLAGGFGGARLSR